MGVAETASNASSSRTRSDCAAGHVDRRSADRRVPKAQADVAIEPTETLRRFVDVLEDEHARIAGEIHDDIGQQLTALRLALERRQPQEGDNEMRTALELTAAIGRGLDSIAWQLRPAVLEQFGLGAALPRTVETWAARARVSAECHVQEYRRGSVPLTAEIAFYRVLQEALTNVARHARASRVDVVLSVSERQAVLLIEDDGVGFDPAVQSRGFGLISMAQRAAMIGASVLVESTAGKGTSVLLRYPLQREEITEVR